MDGSENPLPDNLNPNHFPAKLWLLVNNPTIKAIHWDRRGEAIVIDQQLFEKQILSPNTMNFHENLFKTTHFSSFVRQLNLYGFRKSELTINDESTGDTGVFHYFYNPNFQRNHPELVGSLRRLTVDNKAKMKAGLEVSSRLQNRYQQPSEDFSNRDLKRRSTFLLSPTHQESPHACHPNKVQVGKVHCGTPVPPHHLMKSQGAAFSPNIFPPVSLSQYYTGAATSTSAMHVQQGLPIHSSTGNPNFTSFNLPSIPHQLGHYPTVRRCCHPDLMSPHLVGLQKMLFSPQSYYQGGYPMSPHMFDYNQELQRKEELEAKKRDINLDAIFQIADEVMQASSNTCVVKVETPENKFPVVGITSSSGDTKNTKPDRAWSGCRVATHSPKESLVSQPEQTFEVSTDQVNDEVISVVIS